MLTVTAFLPSSFTMHTTMMAASYWFHPATSTQAGVRRMRLAVFFTALGAIVGWPFAAALGIPIIFEQLFVAGGEIVIPGARSVWAVRRRNNLIIAIIGSALIAVSCKGKPQDLKALD
jgi:alpha-1,2-mannosyltransferase